MGSMIQFPAYLHGLQTTECASHCNWPHSSASLLQGNERSPKEERASKGGSLTLKNQIDESSQGSQQTGHTTSGRTTDHILRCCGRSPSGPPAEPGKDLIVPTTSSQNTFRPCSWSDGNGGGINKLVLGVCS